MREHVAADRPGHSLAPILRHRNRASTSVEAGGPVHRYQPAIRGARCHEPEERTIESAEAPQPPARLGFFRSLLGLAWVIFCFEVGVFLLVYPWMSGWETNFFAYVVPELHSYWDNAYVRGGISGLGVVNIYIALVELFQFLKATLFGS